MNKNIKTLKKTFKEISRKKKKPKSFFSSSPFSTNEQWHINEKSNVEVEAANVRLPKFNLAFQY